jgi:hypothetical protein
MNRGATMFRSKRKSRGWIRSCVVLGNVVFMAALACGESTSAEAPFVTDVITSRSPLAMVVGTPSPNSCNAYEVSLTPVPSVFTGTGARSDTSALIVGRRVSVWTNEAIDLSCIAGAHADKVVVYDR